MDTLSHALYGKGLFGYKKYRWFSFLFGAIPDLFSFGIYFIFQSPPKISVASFIRFLDPKIIFFLPLIDGISA